MLPGSSSVICEMSMAARSSCRNSCCNASMLGMVPRCFGLRGWISIEVEPAISCRNSRIFHMACLLRGKHPHPSSSFGSAGLCRNRRHGRPLFQIVLNTQTSHAEIDMCFFGANRPTGGQRLALPAWPCQGHTLVPSLTSRAHRWKLQCSPLTATRSRAMELTFLRRN